MGLIADRMKLVIARVGETVVFTKLAGSAGTFNVPAVVGFLDGGTENVFLDDVESMGVVRPGLILRLAGDSTVAVGDMFDRDGVSDYVCVKRGLLKVANESVLLVTVFSV